MSDPISEYVEGQFNSSKINRRDLETKWNQNRDYFLGISSDKWKSGEAEKWRSDSFPGFTHQKVVFAMAICIDAVLAGGKIPFAYFPSGFEKNRVRSTGPVDPKSVQRAIEDMTSLTAQQLVDCRAEQVYIKNVLSAALYGWTYGKFVVYNMHREGWAPQTPEVPGIMDWKRLPTTMQQWVKWSEDFLAPGYVYVPVWDIFRDWEKPLSECAYVIHRQPISAWWIRQKIGKPYFVDQNIRDAISKIGSANDRTAPSIQNNPETQNLSPILRDIQRRNNDQRYLEYWGLIPRTVVESFEKYMQTQDPSYQSADLSGENEPGDEIEVCACTLNSDKTVRYVRTKPSMRPFFDAMWEDQGDELAPRGVADNCKEMHNVLKGTFRAIEDNEKLSANVIIAIKERYLKNVPKTLEPGMKLLLAEDCNDARMAVQSVVIPSVTGPLMQLLGVVEKFLDNDSMVPRISQGVREPGDQTAAEASMRQAAASKYIGSAIRNLDNGIIEPLVKAFYDYNMNDPAIQTGKGNYLVQALGFTSFLNKTDRIKALQTLLGMALQSPKFLADTNTKEIRAEITKALDCDPQQFMLSDEQVAQKEQEQAQSPQAQLPIAQGEANVEKTKADAVKSRAQAVKALADAKQTTQTMPHAAGPGGEPVGPQAKGGSDGLDASAGGGESVNTGDGAGLAGGVANTP